MAQKKAQSARPEESTAPKPPAESIKETIDSIIVAFCLAFVFRAFIVEAFVIPTGSMADTLMGKHRDFICADCGWSFPVGVDDAGRGGGLIEDGQMLMKQIICPNCGWIVAERDKRAAQLGERWGSKSLGGDKILVLKFPYLFEPPKRWDVIVFYNPQDPDQNYIKRLIGTPGEAIQIVDGDIYAGEFDAPANQLKIQRKPDDVQEALWRVVYDNDYLPKRHSRADVPGWTPANESSGWDAGGRVLHYRPPEAARAMPSRLDFHPLLTGPGFYDYYSYNDFPKETVLLNVVRDLMLEGVVYFREDGAQLTLSMNKREDRFIAHVFQDGRIQLLKQREGVNYSIGQVQIEPFPIGQGVRVRLQNVDYQASVWVDGHARIRTSDEQYAPPLEQLQDMDSRQESRAGARLPEPEVWMEAVGPLDLAHVKVYRDVYYSAWTQGDRSPILRGAPATEEEVVRLKDWPDGMNDNDEFFVLGDNSPSSLDSRKWVLPPRLQTPYWHLERRINEGLYRAGRVPRDHLIGRAFFVYWPAGLRPFNSSPRAVPNVGRMRLIR